MKDLDDQKAAQRQGDYDGDGLSDGAELDGMLGVNGHVYYSNPYTTDVDHDTDHDHVPDNVEMGEYDPATGKYKVKSDPSDPNSIPGDDTSEPVYIIAWSYGQDEVKEYEVGYLASHNWKTETSYCDTSFLTADGNNSDWTEEMWKDFDNTCLFSRAAKTKKKELIEKGVKEENIKFFRIDGGQELLDLWNDTWAGYGAIQELHIYSHGKNGTPEMYHPGTIGHVYDEKYIRLNFTSNAGCYFYGCNIAKDSNNMNAFASKQNVITYAYDEGTSFSEDYRKKTSILWQDSDVYLAPFVIPGEKSWREYDNEWYAILVVAPKQFAWNETIHIRGRKPFCRFYPETGDID